MAAQFYTLYVCIMLSVFERIKKKNHTHKLPSFNQFQVGKGERTTPITKLEVFALATDPSAASHNKEAAVGAGMVHMNHDEVLFHWQY